MLKAKALCIVQDPQIPEVIVIPEQPEKPAAEPSAIQAAVSAAEITNLIDGKQNICIESYSEQNEVPACITSLAVLLVQKDKLLKSFIKKLRQQYPDRQKSFSFSLAAWSKEERQQIYEIFSEELCGLVDSVYLNRTSHVLSGNLIITPAAQNFLNGQYMEIGILELIRQAMEELADTYQVPYRLYRNVRVAAKSGLPKNEFDIVIECQGIFYVVEVKSGDCFNEWGSLLEVGQEYRIVPHRLLLVDSYLTDVQAGRIEAFCKYYTANLEGGMVKEKVMKMVGADLKKGA